MMELEKKEDYINISESIQVDWKKELDKGSFGEVYAGKIYQRKMIKECAVKFVAQKGIRQQYNTYFNKEADFSIKIIELFKKIRKQQQKEDVKVPLVEIFELVQSVKQDKCCIVMEKCGNSLTSERYYLPQKRYLQINAITIVKQIAQGLEILHSENITHRDINPENIFVTANSSLEVKIGGYGFAPENKDPESTIDGISYMAPEIAQEYLDKQAQNTQTILNPNEIDHQNMPQIVESIKEENEQFSNKVDIWSLGTIFHELITGNQLFVEYDTKETLTQITQFGSYYSKWKTAQIIKSPSKNELLLEDLRVKLEQYLPWKHVSLDRVAKLLDKMLKRNPDERISAAEVVQECGNILNDPQLLREEIQQADQSLLQDETNVDELIKRKEMLEIRFQELEQKGSETN